MTISADADYVPAYRLDNGWRDARRRLQMLEAVYDPLTLRHLEMVGVGPGWRCLEVGAGAGSITRALAERVGPQGRVAAVDLDPRFLLTSRPPTSRCANSTWWSTPCPKSPSTSSTPGRCSCIFRSGRPCCRRS